MGGAGGDAGGGNGELADDARTPRKEAAVDDAPAVVAEEEGGLAVMVEFTIIFGPSLYGGDVYDR